MEVWQKLKLFSTGFIKRVEQSLFFCCVLSLSQINSEEQAGKLHHFFLLLNFLKNFIEQSFLKCNMMSLSYLFKM